MMLGVTERTIYKWKAQAKFVEFLNRLLEEHSDVVQGALLEGELAAVSAIVEALDALDSDGLPNHTIRLKAAFRLMDAAGVRGTPTLKTESKHLEITGDVTELFKNALRDPGVRQRLLESGIVENLPEADYEVVETGSADPEDPGTPEGSEGGPDEVLDVCGQTEPVLQGDSGGDVVEEAEAHLGLGTQSSLESGTEPGYDTLRT